MFWKKHYNKWTEIIRKNLKSKGIKIPSVVIATSTQNKNFHIEQHSEKSFHFPLSLLQTLHELFKLMLKLCLQVTGCLLTIEDFFTTSIKSEGN